LMQRTICGIYMSIRFWGGEKWMRIYMHMCMRMGFWGDKNYILLHQNPNTPP
jgi:hypothetical protein